MAVNLSPANDNDLYNACSEGDLEKVKMLVENGMFNLF